MAVSQFFQNWMNLFKLRYDWETIQELRANTLQTISSVFYVPDLKSNLLSVGQLQEKGYEIIIKEGTCQIQYPKKGLIAEVNMTKNWMLSLYIQNSIHSCFFSRVKDLA